MIGSLSRTGADGQTIPGQGLIGYAENEFRLNRLQADGCPLRQHLETAERQTGRTPEQLKPIDVVPSILYLWAWFFELSGSRGVGPGGPGPLSYLEIDAWARLMGVAPSIWEVQVLKMIDAVFINETLRK